MSKQIVEGLIEVLLDKTSVLSDRDDAAMDLGEYDHEEGLNALLSVATNSDEEEILLASCGESIAQIWIRHNSFELETFDKLSLAAKVEAEALIKRHRPDWLNR